MQYNFPSRFESTIGRFLIYSSFFSRSQPSSTSPTGAVYKECGAVRESEAYVLQSFLQVSGGFSYDQQPNGNASEFQQLTAT